MTFAPSKIRVFYSYSHKDEVFREQLEEHLAILRRVDRLNSQSKAAAYSSAGPSLIRHKCA